MLEPVLIDLQHAHQWRIPMMDYVQKLLSQSLLIWLVLCLVLWLSLQSGLRADKKDCNEPTHFCSPFVQWHPENVTLGQTGYYGLFPAFHDKFGSQCSALFLRPRILNGIQEIFLFVVHKRSLFHTRRISHQASRGGYCLQRLGMLSDSQNTVIGDYDSVSLSVRKEHQLKEGTANTDYLAPATFGSNPINLVLSMEIQSNPISRSTGNAFEDIHPKLEAFYVRTRGSTCGFRRIQASFPLVTGTCFPSSGPSIPSWGFQANRCFPGHSKAIGKRDHTGTGEEHRTGTPPRCA